jgi:radical SAM protein with 4Fe4S-binding SPASM domain
MTIDSNYFCPAPWVSLYVDPQGNIENCCVSKNKLGNINKTFAIKDTISGSNNLDIKTMMLNDIPIEGCKNCYSQIGTHTLQHHFKKKYNHLGDDFYKDTNNFVLKYLDLRWNNTCNFACIYCGPGLSSLWAEQKYQVVKMKEAKGDLLDYVLESAADLEEIYLAGGEPLMIKENEIVLTKLLEVNKSCRICVNSNLSLIQGNKVFELLKQFNNVQWLVSGESIADQYEYIRWPGKWNIFLENLHIINSIPNHRLSFNMVFMNINSLSIWDFIDLVHQDLNIDHRSITVNIYNLRDNNGPWSIQRLTDYQRELVRQRISKNDYSNILGIDNVIASLTDNRPSNQSKWDGLEYTVEEFNKLDQDRKLNSRAIFPDIYDAINCFNNTNTESL